MKWLFALLLLAPATQAHEEEDELNYGIEVLTGFRSEFVDRGFSLSQGLLEVQLAAEVALSDEWLFELGGWYGSGTGSGSFEAASAYFGIRYEEDAWDVGFDATLASYDQSVFRDGVAVGPFVNWYPHEDWRIGGQVHFDSGTDGIHGSLEGEWSRPTGKSSYISVLTGISGVSNFYGRGGLNDAYARVGWTYGINRNVAFTPFVGSSFALDRAASNRLFAGVWFEVNF